MEKFYLTKIIYQTEDEKGKLKNQRLEYLVNAMSVTDAEAKIYKHLGGSLGEFSVMSVTESKIIEVILK